MYVEKQIDKRMKEHIPCRKINSATTHWYWYTSYEIWPFIICHYNMHTNLIDTKTILIKDESICHHSWCISKSTVSFVSASFLLFFRDLRLIDLVSFFTFAPLMSSSPSRWLSSVGTSPSEISFSHCLV